MDLEGWMRMRMTLLKDILFELYIYLLGMEQVVVWLLMTHEAQGALFGLSSAHLGDKAIAPLVDAAAQAHKARLWFFVCAPCD